ARDDARVAVPFVGMPDQARDSERHLHHAAGQHMSPWTLRCAARPRGPASMLARLAEFDVPKKNFEEPLLDADYADDTDYAEKSRKLERISALWCAAARG